MAKVTFNTGNFSLVIEGEPNAETQDRLIENGLRYEIQRDVATKVYAAQNGGKVPKDFKRESVEFSTEAAASFMATAQEELAKRGEFTVSVTKYEGSEGAASPMKRATAFVESLMDDGDKEAQLRSVLALYDASAADGDKDALIAIANKAGLGIQPPRAAKVS